MTVTQHNSQAVIGIVGGVGPYAGLDLQRKILDQTAAQRDQDYLPVISVSWPSTIPDRTEYLLGRTLDNPAVPILTQLRLLAEAGATVAGIPCNTAHAAPIFDVIERETAQFERPLRLLHMIREMADYLRREHPALRRLGVLSTTGARIVGLYPGLLRPLGFEVMAPAEPLQAGVHNAVYHPNYGIKARGHGTQPAVTSLTKAIDDLAAQGAEAIVLGCTELPLVFSGNAYNGRPLIDPTLVLAQALVREATAG